MKNIPITVVALFLFHTATAQISNALINKAIDTFNYSIVKYITSDSKHKDFEKNYKASNQGEDIENRILNAIKDSVLNLEEGKNVSKEINEFKKQNHSFQTKEELIKYLTYEVFVDGKNQYCSHFFLTRSTENSKPNSDLQKNLDKIKAEILAISEPETVKVPLLKNATNAERIRKEKDTVNFSNRNYEIRNSSSGIFKWLWLLPLFCFFGLSAYVNEKFKKIKAKDKGNYIQYEKWIEQAKDELRERINAAKPLSSAQNLSGNNQHQDIIELTERISILELKLQNYNKEAPISIKPEMNTGNKSENQNTKLYFPVPDRNGFFNNSQGRAESSSVSAYEFSIDLNNPNKAAFKIIDKPDVIQNAINSPDNYLIPVCKMNIQPTPGKKIRKIVPGVAELQGNNWSIIEKSLIEFE